MVKLKNIVISGSILECDIYPENSLQPGHVVVDGELKEIIRCELPKGYEWCENHASHARWKLLELRNEKEIPVEKLVMWY